VPYVLSALHLLAKADASDVIAAVAAAIALGSLAVAVLAIGKAGKANELSAKANEIAGGAKELSAEANTIARGANTLSGEVNTIAGEARDLAARSVELDEAAHVERERAARAVLSAALEPAELRSQGSAGYFAVGLVVSNAGGRDAGRTEVEVQIPEFASTNQVCWEDQQHDRNRVRSRPVPGAKMGEHDQWNVVSLERTLENVPARMPATTRLRLPLPIPPERDGPLVSRSAWCCAPSTPTSR
jgi:hypothetical protein